MKQLLISGLMVLMMGTVVFAQQPAAPAADTATMPADKTTPAAQSEPTPIDRKAINIYVRPTAAVRRSRYLKSLFGPAALANTVAGAGISTWNNSPREWGPHWDGFGKRVASGFGRRLINNTVLYGLDEAMGVDSHFYRSEKRDLGSRISNAFISTVTTRKSDGRRTAGIPRIAAAYTSNVVAVEAWYPNRYSYKDGLRNGSYSLGIDVLYNLFTEFIRKK